MNKQLLGTAEEAIRRADEQEEVGDLAGALETLSTAIISDSANPKLHALRGRLHHLRKEWREAIADFDPALALKPTTPTTLFFRGRARSMLDDLDGALADFWACVSLQPDSADAYVEIGDIHYYRHEYSEAREAFTRAMNLDPLRTETLSERIADIETKLRSV